MFWHAIGWALEVEILLEMPLVGIEPRSLRQQAHIKMTDAARPVLVRRESG